VNRKANLAHARELIAAPAPALDAPADDAVEPAAASTSPHPPCSCCGGRMIVVEAFERGQAPRAPPDRRAAA
jgi:hypothetical protein